MRNRTLDLADQFLNGQVAKAVAEWRGEGDSFFAIAVKLRTEHNISVSPDTVRRWLADEPEAAVG